MTTTAAKIAIKNRFTGAVICEGETVKDACEANRTLLIGADLRGANLRGADLSGAELYLADLSGANLSGANLDVANAKEACLSSANLSGAYAHGADLRKADLRWSNLSGATLCWADLRWSNLSGAHLHGAILTWSILDGAKLCWDSHDLMAEILRRAAGADVAKRKVAGLIAVSRDMCWRDFLAIRDPLTDWALSVLREYVVPGDDAPDLVRSAG